jgi:predicted dehydrogenase
MAGLYKAEDTVLADFSFENGTEGQGVWHFAAAPQDKTDTLIIYGSEGSIHFTTYEVIPVRLETKKGTEVFEYSNPENIQYNLIQSIVEELQDKKGACPSTGITAARTNRVMEKILYKE